jgi:hypothetical protein
MKVKIKIPKDGDLKWDDIMLCEYLSIARCLDGEEVVVIEDHDTWLIAVCLGIKRRIPKAWTEKILAEETKKNDDATIWVNDDYPLIAWAAEVFSKSDMVLAFNAGIEHISKQLRCSGDEKDN